MNYRREIDGLRALAVLPVIFFHAGLPPFTGGFVGVDIFFVISGYLITSIILADLKSGNFSIANFYERRARRILPALFFVMAVTFPLAWIFLLPGDMQDYSQSIAAVSVFASNFLFWSESGYFSAAAELKPLLHTWSLAVEEQYYIIFPLFMMLAWKLGQRKLVALLGVAALLSLALAQKTVGIEPMQAFFLLPTRGWELLIGAFAAFYLVEQRATLNSRLANYASWLGLLMILSAIFFFSKKTPVPSVYTLIPTIGALLIILTATPSTMVGKLLGSGIVVGIGLISYSAYLWHQPLFAFVRHGTIETPGRLTFVLLSILTLVLAYLSWRYVEQPFRNRHWLSRRQIFLLAITGSLLFIALGYWGHSTKGFEARYPMEDRELWSIRMAESGNYVRARFDSMKLSDFDANDNRRKVLLIGDSYAQDLVNAIYESELNQSIQLSTFHISSRCGNLYLKFDFTEHIDYSDLKGCIKKNWYQHDKLQVLMKEADVIWLASNWRVWQAEILPQSIKNIRDDFGKPVVVFGTKNFGDVKIKRLLQYPQSERVSVENPLPERVTSVNKVMQSNLDIDTFIDVSGLLCKSHTVCRLFTEEGKLISYDGGHLTLHGARYYGEQLAEHAIIQRIIRQESVR